MPDRTFTFRAVLTGIAGMILLGVWIQFHEVLAPKTSLLAENSPPAGSVGVFLAILCLGTLASMAGKALRLARGELLLVYAMLVIAAPFMTQGMWHRFLGLTVSIPRESHFNILVDSYSDKLWPHGEHLLGSRRFEQGLTPDMTVVPPGSASVVPVEKCQVGPTKGLRLFVPAVGEGPKTASLRIRIPRFRDGREILVPGENYYWTGLFRRSDMQNQAQVVAEIEADSGEKSPGFTLGGNTPGNSPVCAPGGFERTGMLYVRLPREIREHADLTLTLTGPGEVVLTDLNFFSNEALYRLHKGTQEVAGEDRKRLDRIDPERRQRDSLLEVPDSALGRIGYRLEGYIPWRQWAQPLFYWGSIAMAMFLGLLGLGILFRKQWDEHERFSFPLATLPKLLLEEETRDGRTIRPLYRKPVFLAGAAAALLYTLMLGIAHYVPGMPDPKISVNISDYFTDPAIKAYLNGFYHGAPFEIVLLLVAIAFFIDLDMLASVIVFFWLSRIPFYFGELFGWKSLPGIQDQFPYYFEQHIGSFLILGALACWAARRHLAAVGRRILGLAGGADDSAEALPYRAAALLFFGAFAYFGLWGSWTGLGSGSALIFFGFLILCGFSAARLRSEVGIPFTYFTPYMPMLIFYLMGGVKTFGITTMVLAYAAGGFMAVAQFLMFAPSQVEMLHLAHTGKANPRGLSFGMILGALGGILIGGYVVLVWCYGQGSDNIPYMRDWANGQSWYFNPLRGAVQEFDVAQTAQATAGAAEKVDKTIGPWIGVGAGAGITLLLTALRSFFVGFWLHPLGFVLSNTFCIYMCWGSLHVAWLVKWLGLKIGGPKLIRDHMTPFFAGVFCGAVGGQILWTVVALIGMRLGWTDVYLAWP